jgi:hypothetical protein
VDRRRVAAQARPRPRPRPRLRRCRPRPAQDQRPYSSARRPCQCCRRRHRRCLGASARPGCRARFVAHARSGRRGPAIDLPFFFLTASQPCILITIRILHLLYFRCFKCNGCLDASKVLSCMCHLVSTIRRRPLCCNQYSDVATVARCPQHLYTSAGLWRLTTIVDHERQDQLSRSSISGTSLAVEAIPRHQM